MPELPEVETVRRGLEPALLGKRLKRVVTRRRDLRIPFPKDFSKRLEGHRVTALERRAKYILARLDDGTIWLIHLGMSGRVTVYRPGSNSGALLGDFAHDAAGADTGLGPHDHVVIETEEGWRIVYTDHRRFGLMTLIEVGDEATHRLLRDVGPEPLAAAFSPASLGASLRGKATPIKAALLDQTVVAGLGNIYVSEALFRAGISPKRRASTIAGARAERLVPAIQSVLNDAIAAGGSTLRDFAQADGELGYFQHSFQVYDRDGEPCAKTGCSGRVKRIVQAGRSTFYCPSCQR